MPKTTVGAIIVRRAGSSTEVLLTRRNVEPFKGMWCIPGGHVEQYEDAVTAVIREAREETNLEFRPVFLTYLDEIYAEREVHNVVLLFYGEAENDELIMQPEEGSEAGWFELSDAVNKPLAFEHNKALEIFLSSGLY